MATRKTATTMAARLRQFRESQHPPMSLNALAVQVDMLLPRTMWISSEYLRRIEIGKTTEDEANPVILAAIAKVLDVPVEALSSTASRETIQLRDLLGPSSACSAGMARQVACV